MSVCVGGGLGAITMCRIFWWKSLGGPTLHLDGLGACASKLGHWEAVFYLLRYQGQNP